MRTILLLLSILLSIVHPLEAKDKEVIIGGYIQKTVTEYYQTNELIIRFKRTTHSSSTGKYLRVPIDSDGSFKAVLTDTEPLFYVSFEFEGKKTGTIFNASFPKDRTLKEVYLIQEGDSIMVDIQKEGNFNFSGKGSEKLNCEWQIYNLPAIPQSVERRVFDHDNFSEIQSKLTMLNNSVDLAIKGRFLILESYRNQLADSIYDLLYLDLIGSAKHVLSSKIPGFPRRILGDDKKPVLKYYQTTLHEIISKVTDNRLAAESAYFAELLYEIESNILNLNSKYKFRSTQYFGELYNHIKSRYNGKLRDKLILISFEMTSSEASNLIVEDALKTIQDSTFKSLLSDLTRNRNTAFPFEFYDFQNNIHKLSDYKGKLLILETWFYGCVPCKALSKAMHPIFEKYKSCKDVVFITIGTDQRETWIRGIESGQYSNKSMIELHTNDLGFKNPFFRHYNFQGAPHQLIINMQGELIVIDPPRPMDAESIRSFMKIIDHNLSAVQ